jgi:hypothetical protein
MEDEDLPRIGNRSDALELLAVLVEDMERIHLTIEAIQDAIEREII